MPEPIQRGTLPRPSLYQVFRSLESAKATGILHLERDQFRKTVHFEDGRIRFATTTRADERLGAEAVRQHMATWWDVQEAAQGDYEVFGEIGLSPDEIAALAAKGVI